MTEVKQPEGRPLKFKSVKELEEQIDNYFKWCDDRQKVIVSKGIEFYVPDPRPYTITGLAYYLDTYRSVLIDYEDGKYDDPEKTKDENKLFSYTIKKAKARIYAFTEENLYTPKIAPGVIFSLKNNYDWKDRTIVENNFNDKTLQPETEKKIHDKLEAMVAKPESN